MAVPGLGIRLLQRLTPQYSGECRNQSYRMWVIILTFLGYTSYHLSRKPISVVKSVLHRNCQIPLDGEEYIQFAQNDSCSCCWAPFNGDNANELLGSLDLAYLFAYAVAMFFSGHIGERVNLRYFLTFGMIMSGLFTILFGMGYFWNVHTLPYYIVVQIIGGAFQSTGWPSMVAVMGNWFGKGRRGLIMGIWNSHTSVGNILGSLIAGIFVDDAWGLSFIVPGVIISTMGIIIFLFLIVHPADVGCTLPDHESGNTLHQGRDAIINKVVPPEDQKPISISRAILIPGVIEFALCLFFAKLVSYTFLFWLPTYIHSSTKFTDEQAADLSTLFDIGGIIGGIISGVISDRLGGRACTVFVSLALGAPMMYIYSVFGHIGLTENIFMLIACGILVNGPYALITTAVAADLGTHPSLNGNSKALSTVTALIDGTGSIGAALGPLLTGLISPSGWSNVFYMLIAADLAACLLVVRLVIKELTEWLCSEPKDITGSTLSEPLLNSIIQDDDYDDVIHNSLMADGTLQNGVIQ
ncbi:glucose-6-phosphate exchanger SLC37A2-like [Glandiceps talaboti]